MPNPNSTRYPLVAIPESLFEILHQGLDERRTFGKSRSVNELVQVSLNFSPMFDYLLVPQYAVKDPDPLGRGYTGEVRTSSDILGNEGPYKLVRVTESQYEMLQIRQQQYQRDGRRISLACIVTSMLFQHCKLVREYLFNEGVYRNGSNREEDFIPTPPLAFEIGAGEVKRVRRTWREGDRIFTLTNEDELPGSSVIVGWTPK